MTMSTGEIEKIELELLAQAIYNRYGYDFRNYAFSSFKRRVQNHLDKTKISSISTLTHRVLYDSEFFSSFLIDMSVTVTEMFRDPMVYKSIRETIIPTLRTYPFLKIWHAGCATGEEAYSMAILLEEEGLLERSQIYATDINTQSLSIANEGIYAIDKIKEYTDNHFKSGGKRSLSDYYHARYNSVKLKEKIKQKITFSHHNLVTDHVFGEMNLVICRNVLIYFNKDLQNKVMSLLKDSLCPFGYLVLGNKESIDFSDIKLDFQTLSKDNRIYRKISAVDKAVKPA